jgi:hypothetical protein
VGNVELSPEAEQVVSEVLVLYSGTRQGGLALQRLLDQWTRCRRAQ